MKQVSRARRVPTVVVALALTVSLLPLGEADSAGLPDLVTSSVGAGGSAAVAGGPIQLIAKVKNAGGKSAGKSKTAFLLSKDGKRNTGDITLGKAPTSAIKPGKTSTIRLKATVPGKVKPAKYLILACSDDAKAVREGNESNNCSASTKKLEVIAPYDSTPFGPADPVDADPQLDQGSTTSQTVTPEGGQMTLVVTGVGTFRLDVPAGALTESVEISMTSLVNVTGTPFDGGFRAAVKLEPAGLTFERPAMLTIVPAVPVPPGEEAPFAAEGNGDDFHLHPVLVESTETVFPLLHFTIVGLFGASSVQQTAQMARRPVSPQHALEQELQGILGEARRRSLQGGEGLTEVELGKLVKIGKNYYDKVARPLLLNAANGANCATAAAQAKAVKTGLLWARQMELLGLDGFLTSRIDEMYRLIEKIRTVKCSPNRWSGQVSGTYTKSNGLTESWSGTVTFTKDYEDEYMKGFSLTGGSFDWTLGGLDANDCDWSGQVTLVPTGSGAVMTDPAGYGFNIGTSTFSTQVTKACPEPFGTTQVEYEILRNVDWGSLYGGEFSGGDTDYKNGDNVMTGSRTFEPPQDPGGFVTIQWNLTGGA